MADKEKETTSSFKESLNLPRTDFPIRASAAAEDPAMLARWQSENLSSIAMEHNKGAKSFILHDGPPYANGTIHLGHAYNKILKDIATKSHRMMGYHVPVIPGWDCHGLPIEIKVTKEKPGLDRTALQEACRDYAQHWIEVQKEEFKKLGILMDWEHPYLTMDYGYQAWIMRAFAAMVEQNYIERKNKTVPWCSSCQTVLASAEIEYADRKDPSIYVSFTLTPQTTQQLFPAYAQESVGVLVWTTTPWTLPLNRAVLLAPQEIYQLIKLPTGFGLVGQSRADAFCALLGIEKEVVATISAHDIEKIGPQAYHPLNTDRKVPLILDNSVLLTDGTACVHNAPGAGPEDYEVGVKNNLEIYSPVGPDGRYTDEIEPKELAGMPIADGQIWVIKKLAAEGRLIYKTSIRHSYPHCWRCHNGLIFRATKQWFCDLSRHQLKERAIASLDTIHGVPEKSINRLRAAMQGRLEWCLSRQRIWGVPIIALICNGCDASYTSPTLVRLVADNVEKKGISYWNEVSVEELINNEKAHCIVCGTSDFRKEMDILDVWFDSGVSHYAVLRQRAGQQFPADLYLEGKDQHRGWFQSSVLTSVAIEKEPAMKTIVSHGFTVDAQGHKMSKSLGNVVTPGEMIAKLGTDGLRLWASSIDCAAEATISPNLLNNVQETFRKVRNTARFLLSNLYDFDPAKDMLDADNLLLIDQYGLLQLKAFDAEVHRAYKSYDFTAFFHAIGNYCSVELSSFYLDIIKDRLYVEQSNGHLRRSAQTVCWQILDTMTKLMAPVLSFTAEQIADHYQGKDHPSIHLQQFNDLEQLMLNEKIAALDWQAMKEFRSQVLRAIERLREEGTIKHSLEASVQFFAAPESKLTQTLQAVSTMLAHESLERFCKEFFIVSAVERKTNADHLEQSGMDGLFLRVERIAGVKCPRCWQWGAAGNHDDLCNRCVAIVG